MKLTGTYHRNDSEDFIQVGLCAYITCAKHPTREDLTNVTVRTTAVENYDPVSGRFETKNTIYKPA